MNAAERAIAYRIALAGRGRPDEAALARICADLPSHLDDQAEATWEGALLAGVLPRQLQGVVAAGNWSAVATLAGPGGRRPLVQGRSLQPRAIEQVVTARAGDDMIPEKESGLSVSRTCRTPGPVRPDARDGTLVVS